ncbi:S41 family peptidase [Gimibacter soli]|uniref:S41 family peptidase n=1 Tax=Gimibacter soli TaxID=3024400 RepID=A0AAE9XMU0_9PROT|nr:S41 family peptidase [Gimibacter soli]WCL53888.1 S41 family peptidase [Gimibacter soli]
MRTSFKRAAVALMMAPMALGAFPAMAEETAAAKSSEDVYEQLDLLMRVFQRVRSEYVDEVDDKEVIEAAIQGMLRSLDPHSTYLNPEVFQQVRVQTEGEYGGLGLEVQMDNGLVKVVSPIDDTPAQKAGIKGGDYITHIDGTSVIGKTLTESVKEMRGPVGSMIKITVVREGEEGSHDYDIMRDKILVRSVRHRVEDETIGYLRITTFNMQTGDGVENSIKELKAQLGDKMDGLIIDLRNNPGGLLNEAIRVSDDFLDRGEIVSTRGRRRQNNNRWYATAGDMLDGMPIVVLVNAYSASASEIVAGALQDHRRAVLVGDQTFGKGTVQSEIRLGRNGDQALRLTTARYYTPSGRSIQERGIEPDLYVFNDGHRPNLRRESDLNNSIHNEQSTVDRTGEEEDEDPKLNPISATPEPAEGEAATPPVDRQLKYAIKLLKDMSALPTPQVAEARPHDEQG